MRNIRSGCVFLRLINFVYSAHMNNVGAYYFAFRNSAERFALVFDVLNVQIHPLSIDRFKDDPFKH